MSQKKNISKNKVKLILCKCGSNDIDTLGEEKFKTQIPIPIWQRSGVETGENREEEKTNSMLYEAKEKIKIQKGTGIDKNTGENTNTNSNMA